MLYATMTKMTLAPERIAELRALCNAATPGPWFIAYSSVHSNPLTDEYARIERAIPEDAPDDAYEALPETSVAHVPVVGGDTPTRQGHRDGEFIAAARTALPEVLDEIERLRGLLRESYGALSAVGHVSNRMSMVQPMLRSIDAALKAP